MATKRTETQTEDAPKIDPTIQLIQALASAIESTRPATKKDIFTRKAKTPWTPPDGVTKLKLKRKIYQHGLLVDEDFIDNATIAALNRLRPGQYFGGYVSVIRRRDKGIDIDYKYKSPQDRMALSSRFGIHSFQNLVERMNEEADKPKKSEFDLSEED